MSIRLFQQTNQSSVHIIFMFNVHTAWLCHLFLMNDTVFCILECNWYINVKNKTKKDWSDLVHTHTESVIKCECDGGHLQELQVLERVHLYSERLTEQQGRQMGGGSGYPQYSLSSSNRTTSNPEHHFHTHSLEHTICPCILSQVHKVMDDFRQFFSSEAGK